MMSINIPCCVTPKRECKAECANFNHSTDVIKLKTLQLWLLTLQNIDRNSWVKLVISSGIGNLTNTGDFIIHERQLHYQKKVEMHRITQGIVTILYNVKQTSVIQ